MNNINFSDLSKNMKDIKNTHINIGTGVDITIKDLALIIKKEIGFKGQVEFDVTKPDGTLKKLQDVSKLRSLGWEHKIDLKDGIRDTVKWYTINKLEHK